MPIVAGEITAAILQVLMDFSNINRDEKWARFMILCLALLYLGRETLEAIEYNILRQAQILVGLSSWAGSANVLEV